MLEIAIAERPPLLIRVSVVMGSLAELSGPRVWITYPPLVELGGSMWVTEVWKVVSPPRDWKAPSRWVIRPWESTVPVEELSSTPALARTSGSRSWACWRERKWVGTSMERAKLWTLTSSSHCCWSCATIHFFVLR